MQRKQTEDATETNGRCNGNKRKMQRKQTEDATGMEGAARRTPAATRAARALRPSLPVTVPVGMRESAQLYDGRQREDRMSGGLQLSGPGPRASESVGGRLSSPAAAGSARDSGTSDYERRTRGL